VRKLILFGSVLLLAGCDGKPSAPALTADEEYYDANAGIRFPTPPNFRIFIKAELPKGRIEEPIMLAAYQNTKAKVRTAIEVMAADVAENQDLGEFLKTHPVGSEKWKSKAPAEPVTIGGRAGVRMAFGYRDEREHAREVNAVRWSGRAFFVIVIYPPDDPAARDVGRAMLDKVEWLKHN
jgi:hypothetical protein